MRLDNDFFSRDVLQVAPDLVGKTLVRRLPDGAIKRLRITETEAYRGEADTACHARHGRTKRAEILYRPGGTIYVYLCYGIHWLINIVTGPEGFPQAALIRACEGAQGPGKLTKALAIDGRFNGLPVADLPDLWLESDGNQVDIISDKRVGIAYASLEDQNKLWRFKEG